MCDNPACLSRYVTLTRVKTATVLTPKSPRQNRQQTNMTTKDIKR